MKKRKLLRQGAVKGGLNVPPSTPRPPAPPVMEFKFKREISLVERGFNEIVMAIEDQKRILGMRALTPDTVYVGKQEADTLRRTQMAQIGPAGIEIVGLQAPLDKVKILGLSIREVIAESHIGVGFEVEVVECKPNE